MEQVVQIGIHELRVTVIAAGFERWDDGRAKKTGKAASSGSSRDDDVSLADVFADADEEFLDGGDDDEFDVPSFLK